MSKLSSLLKNLLAVALITAPVLVINVQATIVEFQTSQGNFKINLHDQTTPETVANFLKYVNDGDYNNTVVHRVEPNFVMQAGGYAFSGDFPLNAIATDSAVINEPVYSNVRGTIAMAKVAGNVNSATSQWFINLSNNSVDGAVLDQQNGGFTVFGEVIEDGMTTVDAIATLPTCTEIPMPNYTAELCADSTYVPGVENFVTIEQVTIIDSSSTTADSLSPILNTSLTPVTPDNGGGSSGGSIFWFGLALMSLTLWVRKRFKR
jgi:peptidyl-prolyl cis-trans isomerase A (cyclophilin A)